MSHQTWIKILQIVITGIAIGGTALVFFNSPFASGGTFLYKFGEAEQHMVKAKKQRRLAKFGFLLILISYVLQTIVIFL